MLTVGGYWWVAQLRILGPTGYKTCKSELIAESEDLEDETDEELECEVVSDDVDSDYVLDL